MPRLDGLLETSLYVDDLARSAEFYQSLFGFDILVRSDRLIALAVPTRQVLLLFMKRASATMPDAPHDGEGNLHLAFAIPLGELAAWEARLQELGIAVELKKPWERGGHSLYFCDPDGHLVELATPGVWANY